MTEDDISWEFQTRDCWCRHCRSGGYYWQEPNCLWYRPDGDHRGAPGVPDPATLTGRRHLDRL